jgi:hypothetical protein
MRWNGMWNVGGRTEIRAGFWWGNPKERHHFEKLGVNGRIILKRILKIGREGPDTIHLALDGRDGGLL